MLYQLSYFRKNKPYQRGLRPRSARDGPEGFVCNPDRFCWWEVMDSNHRRRTPADLQSAPFGHSGNFPIFLAATLRFTPSRFTPSRLSPSRLTPPLCLASAVRADGGIRTPDQLITNQLLWPTELHRQNRPFWIAKVGIKNLSAKLSEINFLFFHSSQRTGMASSRIGGEIGCKFRKSFGYHNSFVQKYHPFGFPAADFRRKGSPGEAPRALRGRTPYIKSALRTIKKAPSARGRKALNPFRMQTRPGYL